MPRRNRFTKHQIETAILVMMESRIVCGWVTSEAKFLGLKPDTPEWKTFSEREKRAMAERLLR